MSIEPSVSDRGNIGTFILAESVITTTPPTDEITSSEITSTEIITEFVKDLNSTATTVPKSSTTTLISSLPSITSDAKNMHIFSFCFFLIINTV